MYVTFRCATCGAEFSMLTEMLTNAELSGRYISCPLDGRHSDVKTVGRYDDMKYCMESKDTYKRESGRIKQVGYGK